MLETNKANHINANIHDLIENHGHRFGSCVTILEATCLLTDIIRAHVCDLQEMLESGRRLDYDADERVALSDEDRERIEEAISFFESADETITHMESEVTALRDGAL